MARYLEDKPAKALGIGQTPKEREKWRRNDQRKRERKAAGLDTFVFRFRNG